MTDILAIVAVVAMLAAFAVCAVLAALLWRARNPSRPAETVIADLAHQQSDAVARLQGMIASLQQGQSQLQKAVNERLDSVSHRLGDSLQKTTQHTADHLQKLHERLAVIDGAQKNITELASQVTSLQGVLANKQERGAFGQGRMELIVRDGLPKNCYEFQYTLSNKTRPDCAVFLPGQRPLIIDAKFPLEAVSAYKDAKSDDERRAAGARVRADIVKHVADIAQKYLIPGETQDIALMFVPSESLYADLQESFDDVVQKAFRARVVIVSPSLLMVAVHLIQQMQKEERMRAAAGQIQAEVGKLIEDVNRTHDRVLKLQGHFNQAGEDVRQILISSEKAQKRGTRIAEVEFEDDGGLADAISAPVSRKLEAGE
ncbi:MAG TPA: DNA recombination protein RmuC [Xanthobacteraceae bacterium]|nr:DNA recombination protein RmuC [Xanthobacteraceae bacterium]